MECLAKWKVRCQLLKCFDGKVIAKPPIPMGRNERYIVYIFRYLHTFGWIFYGFFMLVNIYIYIQTSHGNPPMGSRGGFPGGCSLPCLHRCGNARATQAVGGRCHHRWGRGSGGSVRRMPGLLKSGLQKKQDVPGCFAQHCTW